MANKEFYKERNMFKDLFEDDPVDLDRYVDDIFGLLHLMCTIEKIEFEGYFQTKWQNSANTISNFDEEYFANKDRRNLYVYKAAEINEYIFNVLQLGYRVASLKIPTMQDVHREIYLLQEKGVKF